MKRIGWIFPVGSNSRAALAPLLALLAFAPGSGAAPSTRPQTGGTLRVQIGERIGAIDPRRLPTAGPQAAAAERVESLVFDRLVRLDERGNVQPALAISWQHDAQFKRWQFRLREGVKFSDGTSLTAPVAAMSLQQLLGTSFDVSASSDSVVIQSENSLPDFPAMLALGRYFIFHSGEHDTLAGTGPFTETVHESIGSVERIGFAANESCWAGRPFVNQIDLMMSGDSEQRANAIAFGQADVVELPAAQVRRAGQRGIRTVSSEAIELFAMVVDASRAAVSDARVRQAISLSIDRASISGVILQKQATPAGGLLPNWISGYAHLFPPVFDAARGKQQLAASGRELSRLTPLVLNYDSGDADARAIVDRVAVNLREVGIKVQVAAQSADGKSKASAPDLRLVRVRVASPDRASALSELLRTLGEPSESSGSVEQDFLAERAAVDAFRVIPLVHVSESYGLSPQVRDWMAPRWGGWNLADVWLAAPVAAGGGKP
jgi:peptide/nickel transport system substrate-binding protein